MCIHDPDYFYVLLCDYFKGFDVKQTFRFSRMMINYLQQDIELKSDVMLALSPEYQKGDIWQKRRNISEFDIEILVREVIKNYSLLNNLNKTIKDRNDLLLTMHYIRDFEGVLIEKFGPQDPILILNRLAHRQFIWQAENVNKMMMYRYYRIYSGCKSLHDIVLNKTNLTVKQMFQLGMGLIGFYYDFDSMKIMPKMEIPGLTEENMNNFISTFSMEIGKISNYSRGNNNVNEKYFYQFNVLREYPLVVIEDQMYCPIPTYIFWRITNGIFYLLKDEKNFGDKYGKSFEDYLYSYFEKIGLTSKWNIAREKKYIVGGVEKHGLDFTILDNTTTLFVECKARRMNVVSKSASVLAELDESIKNLVDDIVKAYKNVNDCINGNNKNYFYSSDQNLFLVFVTLEEWFIYGELKSRLIDKVKDKLDLECISKDILEMCPMLVCSVKDLELGLFVSKMVGLKNFLSGFTKKENSDILLAVYIRNKFSQEEVSFVFPFESELNEMFSSTESKEQKNI